MLTATAQQDKLFDWFVENYADIYKQYGIGYFIVKDNSIFKRFNVFGEAVREAQRLFSDGTYIVQECDGTPTAYTGYIAGMSVLASAKELAQ